MSFISDLILSLFLQKQIKTGKEYFLEGFEGTLIHFKMMLFVMRDQKIEHKEIQNNKKEFNYEFFFIILYF
jgi:hypothetical protein